MLILPSNVVVPFVEWFSNIKADAHMRDSVWLTPGQTTLAVKSVAVSWDTRVVTVVISVKFAELVGRSTQLTTRSLLIVRGAPTRPIATS